MANVEGEAAKRMAGATAKGGRVSGIVGALFASNMMGGGKKSAGKSGIDYHNAELAKQKDYERQTDTENRARLAAERAKRADFGRETQRADYVLEASDKRPDVTDLSRSQTGTSIRKKVTAVSTSGQGTTGNTQGKQFVGKQTTKAPKVPKTPKA